MTDMGLHLSQLHLRHGAPPGPLHSHAEGSESATAVLQTYRVRVTIKMLKHERSQHESRYTYSCVKVRHVRGGTPKPRSTKYRSNRLKLYKQLVKIRAEVTLCCRYVKCGRRRCGLYRERGSASLTTPPVALSSYPRT